MTTTIDVLSFRNILDKANEFLDICTGYIREADGTCHFTIPNPTNIGYSDLGEIWAYERFARIKYRDPEKLIEYQIDLLPWNMALNYNIWNDNRDKPPTILMKQHIKFTDTEEEYFQRMTQQDNSYFSMEELRDAKVLMKRIYQYFEIEPVKQEK